MASSWVRESFWRADMAAVDECKGSINCSPLVAAHSLFGAVIAVAHLLRWALSFLARRHVKLSYGINESGSSCHRPALGLSMLVWFGWEQFLCRRRDMPHSDVLRAVQLVAGANRGTAGPRGFRRTSHCRAQLPQIDLRIQSGPPRVPHARFVLVGRYTPPQRIGVADSISSFADERRGRLGGARWTRCLQPRL